jgi:hypothetical protein
MLIGMFALGLHWLYLAADLAGLAGVTFILWRMGHRRWEAAAPALTTLVLAVGFQTVTVLVAHVPPWAFGLYNILQPPLALVVPVFIVVIAFSRSLMPRPGGSLSRSARHKGPARLDCVLRSASASSYAAIL